MLLLCLFLTPTSSPLSLSPSQTFNMSPDEAAYNRLIFCREDVSNSLVMIQPSLICYSFQAPPQPVLLDATR